MLECLVLSNGIFLRRGTLPPWAATPTDVPPRIPLRILWGGSDRRQRVLSGACRTRGTVASGKNSIEVVPSAPPLPLST